jgi:putative peptidoglycan lipid II flippase
VSFFKSLLTIGGNTVLSRILGFVRDRMVYSTLGLSPMADAFSVAVKAPALFRRLFAEGAFNAAFVPTFSEIYAQYSAAKAKHFAERTFTLLALVLLALVIFIELFMGSFLGLIAGGFSERPETLQYAIMYTRITFPYILFISLTALIGGVLNSLNKFGAASATQILSNIVVISYFYFFKDTAPTPGHAASWGSLYSGFIQMVWLHWMCTKQTGLSLRFRWPKIDDHMRSLFKLFVPGLIGSGIVQVNLFVNMAIGSRLQTGGLTSLHIADRVNQLPLGIIGVAMGTALLPLLFKQITSGETKEALSTQNRALELCLLFTLPATLTFIVFADAFIATLFMDNKFGLAEVLQTAPALVAYSTGLPAYVILKVISTIFFAHKDTKTPMFVAAIAFAINAILSLGAVYWLNAQNLGHIGVAGALSISSWINVFALVGIAIKRKFLKFDSKFYTYLLHSIVATLCLAVALDIVEDFFKGYMLYGSFLKKALGLLGLTSIGVTSFFIVAYFLGLLKIKDVIVKENRR